MKTVFCLCATVIVFYPRRPVAGVVGKTVRSVTIWAGWFLDMVVFNYADGTSDVTSGVIKLCRLGDPEKF